jgi:dUTP pyrophosphatase
VIDADYRGELFVGLYNHSKTPIQIEPGERVAQLVITPFLKAEYKVADILSDTQRGEQGFGSTGRK